LTYIQLWTNCRNKTPHLIKNVWQLSGDENIIHCPPPSSREEHSGGPEKHPLQADISSQEVRRMQV